MSQVEAMACGLPVVSTSVGGVGYVNCDGESGLVVPPADSKALGAALNRILGDEALRDRLSQGALQRAQDEFDLPRFGERLKQVYREALGRRGQTGMALT